MTVCCFSICLSESVNTLPWSNKHNHLATQWCPQLTGIWHPHALCSVVVNGLTHLFCSCYVRSKSMLKVPLNIYARCRVIGKITIQIVSKIISSLMDPMKVVKIYFIFSLIGMHALWSPHLWNIEVFNNSNRSFYPQILHNKYISQLKSLLTLCNRWMDTSVTSG